MIYVVLTILTVFAAFVLFVIIFGDDKPEKHIDMHDEPHKKHS